MIVQKGNILLGSVWFCSDDQGRKKCQMPVLLRSLVVWGHFTFNDFQTLKMSDILTCLYNLSDLV